MVQLISGASQPVHETGTSNVNVVSGNVTTTIDTSTPLDVLLPDSQGFDFFSSINLGLVPSAFSSLIVGTNPAVPAGAIEPAWSSGATFDPPVNATVVTIVSTSANDSIFIAGSGAQLIGVDGLDSNRDYISEFVPLNGQTPVTTTLPYIRQNICQVVQAGSSETNEGTITFTIDGKLVATMLPSTGQVIEGVSSLPRNHTALIWAVSLQAAKGDSLALFITVRYSIDAGVSFVRNRFGPIIEVFQTTSALTYPIAADISPPLTDVIVEVQNLGTGVAPATATMIIGIFDTTLI